METIVPIIRDLRNRLGFTQEDFASELGTSVSTVCRWEKGHSIPSKLARKSLTRVAGMRGVDVESMVADFDRRAA
jgi:putative transcriptional regulator